MSLTNAPPTLASLIPRLVTPSDQIVSVAGNVGINRFDLVTALRDVDSSLLSRETWTPLDPYWRHPLHNTTNELVHRDFSQRTPLESALQKPEATVSLSDLVRGICTALKYDDRPYEWESVLRHFGYLPPKPPENIYQEKRTDHNLQHSTFEKQKERYSNPRRS